MAYCSSCNAEITWCKTVNARNMPVDAKPAPTGNMVVESSGVARAATDKDRRLHRDLYTSHFATCPNARQHRRR